MIIIHVNIKMYSEIFGSKSHISPYYLFASNNFIKMPHFSNEGIPINNEQINRFTKFISSMHLDNISLQSYLDDGGNLYDSYEYFQRGNGDYNIITIPKIIIMSGSVKLIREMIYIEPECVNDIIDNYSILFHAIRYGHDDIINLLLLHGANPNVKGKMGKTSLYQAINKGNPEIVKKLLDNGANPNMQYALSRCNYLYTALYNNAWSYEKEIKLNCKKIVKMLIKHGVEYQREMYNTSIQRLYDEIINEMKENGEY
jgi:hypothetical protein